MARPSPQSFLLRLWRERAGAPARVTLIPVAQPQTPRHFATLEALQEYLRAQGDVTADEPWTHMDCTRSEPQ